MNIERKIGREEKKREEDERRGEERKGREQEEGWEKECRRI
jgi:hypothetical protein